jgi:hypothetical protein
MAARNSGIALALATVLGAGCVQMAESECRASDWYQLGYRDGMYGIQRQDDVYAHECGKVSGGPSPDRARYAQGWQEGWWEFERRKFRGGT